MSDMNDIQRTLGKLLANQESFLAMLEKHIEEDKELTKRITKMETGWAYAGGVIMTVGVAISFIVNAVLKKFGVV